MNRASLGAWLTIAVFILVLIAASWWEDHRCGDEAYWDNSSETCEVILDP